MKIDRVKYDRAREKEKLEFDCSIPFRLRRQLSHEQLAELLLEMRHFYGWRTIKGLLKWYRRSSKRKNVFGQIEQVKLSRQKLNYKVRRSVQELNEFVRSEATKKELDKARSLGVNVRPTIESLLEIPYEDLRWVAQNIGKAHMERRYRSSQFQYGKRGWNQEEGLEADNPDHVPQDDIPSPQIGSPSDDKYRDIVRPTKRQVKKWLALSRLNRRLKKVTPKRKNRKVVELKPMRGTKYVGLITKWNQTLVDMKRASKELRNRVQKRYEKKFGKGRICGYKEQPVAKVEKTVIPKAPKKDAQTILRIVLGLLRGSEQVIPLVLEKRVTRDAKREGLSVKRKQLTAGVVMLTPA